MELTDELRYPTIPMNYSKVNASSTFVEFAPIAKIGILGWFLQQKKIPSAHLNEELIMMGVAFHRGILVMEKVADLLYQLGNGNCGPSSIPLNSKRCTTPGRPLHALYLLTRDLDPYLKGMYRLDAFLEKIQHSIWNQLHDIYLLEDLSAQMEGFARTSIPFSNGCDWLSTSLNWLHWIEQFNV